MRTASTRKATAIRRMIAVTAAPNAWVSRSTWRLNHAKNPFCGGGECLSMSAHIAGVSVRATKPDSDTEMTMVTANCL